jgi:hypothetical protein
VRDQVSHQYRTTSKFIFLYPPSRGRAKNYAVKTRCRSGGIATRVLNLDTRRWVVSFTPRPLYPRGKSTVPIV